MGMMSHSIQDLQKYLTCIFLNFKMLLSYVVTLRIRINLFQLQYINLK